MEDSQGRAGRRSSLVAIHVCGVLAGALIFGVVLAGVLVEARQMWAEGAASFVSDAGMRLFAGACIAILSAGPYLILARASRETDPPTLIVIAAVAMLAFQLWFMIDILLFARSSTAAIGLLFMPFYLYPAAGAVCLATVFARRVKRRSSNCDIR